jgi:drug/metabolite transporter (DMT)-like permease
MTLATDRRLQAALLAVAGVGVASAQDAIIKSVAGDMPLYEAVIIRGSIGAPILAVWLALTSGFSSLVTPLIWPLLIRGLVLCSAYFAFILAIAAMPIANAVAIYFTMPFFVASLAGPFLGEKVPLYRWLAMIAGFIGVVIMARPGSSTFEPASFLALYAAFGYAVGQMMGRHYSQRVPPIAIANIQNAVYLAVAFLMLLVFGLFDLKFDGHKSLAFLTRPMVVPAAQDMLLLVVMGVMAALGSVLFTMAYKSAPANFVAPFEYTAMIWAVTFGLLFFADFPDALTWLGMLVVIASGFWMMWRDNNQRTG